MIREKTDLVIIIPPMGEGVTVYPPYGAMYVASALREKGYRPAILNLDTEPLATNEIIERIRAIDPAYIGFSGIVAPSYSYIKNLSHELRRAFPDKMQILGGGLSSAAEVVLRHTAVDIVVRGEGDVTIVELMDRLEKGERLSGVAGIYYRDGPSIVNNGPRRLIMNLDALPYPAFDLINIEQYLPDGAEFIDKLAKGIVDKRFYESRKSRKMMTIPTSRGCFNECSFCFRAYPGLRVHSMKYVFDLVEYCIEKFGVGFFTFGDECFAPTKKRNWEFIEEYKRRRLDVVFRIFGMRVDTIDKDILRAYKEIGCWMIEYGFESGSQRMLNIINKRVTVEQNRRAAIWTNEAGIYTSPALVLAMPGETTRTIDETIEFLKSLDFDFKQYQWKYAIPIPGSQLYDFAKLTGAIEDEDEYLSSLVGEASSGGFNVNLTDEPDEVVASWEGRLKDALDEGYLWRRYKIKGRAAMRLIRFFRVAILYCKRGELLAAIARKAAKAVSSIFMRTKQQGGERNFVRFRKKRSIDIEEFFRGINSSVLNREMSLKSVNAKLRERTP